MADDISALQNNLLHPSVPSLSSNLNSFDHSRPTGSSCICTWHWCNNSTLWLTSEIYCNCLYKFAIVGNIDIWYSFIHSYCSYCKSCNQDSILFYLPLSLLESLWMQYSSNEPKLVPSWNWIKCVKYEACLTYLSTTERLSSMYFVCWKFLELHEMCFYIACTIWEYVEDNFLQYSKTL